MRYYGLCKNVTNGRTDSWTHVRKAFYSLPTMAFGRRQEIINKWENPDFRYPDSDPDHSQDLMGSKMDQDPSSRKPI